MFPNLLQPLIRKCTLSFISSNFFRSLRSIAPRDGGPKIIEGKVKTVTQYDDYDNSQSNFKTYKDFIKSIKDTNSGNELEVEKQFLNDDYYGDVHERCDMYHDMHEGLQKRMKSNIKKNIIGRKYFKLEKETNLLTYAAKEQIRFLHKSNPLEWNCKALSECFPISETGAKKLLKCNFVLTCPIKIKLHDEDVARKWEILKSGKPTDEIFPLTLKLYNEGKLVDDYFSGNPNLPTVPPSNKKIIEIEKKEEIGVFSSIVKTYINYQKQKLLESGENSSEKQVSLRDSVVSKMNNAKNIKKFKYANEELDDDDVDPQVYPSKRKKYVDDGEIPFSQFKEILKEETSSKLKSKYANEYDDFVMQETSKTGDTSIKITRDDQNSFQEIPKYKNENLNLMYEKSKNANTIYKYDEKTGYQYPFGRNVKGKINIPSKRHNNRKLHKVGQSIYDGDGDFLYRVP